ncbi:MAG TPA: NAD(P)/FAD-dependent oxidoreductase [Candidatus Limnocylindrales bacterium]|nr:NAD(P)/FAD-dependent oxidoreductase [Candidatus Limnocylindrales bacterium]
MPDAVVVGAGPNGLAAAIALARAGKVVTVLEGADRIGGGTRSEPLTLPGFTHDVCSAIHPLARISPFFQGLPLEARGLTFIEPPVALAHPLDGGRVAIVERSVRATADAFGRDAGAYFALMAPLARRSADLVAEILRPVRPPAHPLFLARFGLHAIRSATALARSRFHEEGTRAIFTGMAAHAMLPLDRPPTGAFALLLGMTAHAVGWPLARGGSQRIADALALELQAHGGEIRTGSPVSSAAQLPAHRAALYDVTPRQLLAIAGDRFPASFQGALQRYRYGPGVFKVDWALDDRVPWAAPACLQAGTVHVGGSMEEIVASEAAVSRGEVPQHPFVLFAQQSLFDDSRAPAGKHTGWAYCHVPNGSQVDMTERIEAQIERFAPGFRDRILARHVMDPAAVERHDPNCVGGDINGGIADLRQLFFRPTPRLYATPDRRTYLCSSSTPPGGGVHGLCGYFAARRALSRAPW